MTIHEHDVLSWLVSEVDGKRYWIIGTGIYADNDLTSDLYSDLPIELRNRILENAESNIL